MPLGLTVDSPQHGMLELSSQLPSTFGTLNQIHFVLMEIKGGIKNVHTHHSISQTLLRYKVFWILAITSILLFQRFCSKLSVTSTLSRSELFNSTGYYHIQLMRQYSIDTINNLMRSVIKVLYPELVLGDMIWSYNKAKL